MLEPLRNPANWDNFRKAAVLVLIIWAAASAVLCIIYFFILGGRSPAPADIFRALIFLFLSPLSLRPIAGLAQVQEPGGPAVKREAEEEWGKDKKPRQADGAKVTLQRRPSVLKVKGSPISL